MTMRRWLVPASFLLPLTMSAPALADGDCPPGSWFCEDVEVPQPDLDDSADAPAQADDGSAQAQPDKAAAKKKKKSKKKAQQTEADGAGKTVVVQGQEGGETVVVVRQQPGQRVVVVGPDGQAAEPPPEPAPAEPRKKKARRWRERFGLNLRLEGAAFMARQEGAGMGGIGASFRWRPSPYFALDVGTDLLGGVDYDGNDRVEFAGELSGLVFFNPGDVVQLYGIGGIHVSHAEVDTQSSYCDFYYCDYGWNDTTGRDYVGAQGGLGVEFRLSRHIGLMFDGLALIRQKVDDGPPEFVDAATGETSNTSAAGLFRAGINFWW
jgi:hypothetical protein